MLSNQYKLYYKVAIFTWTSREQGQQQNNTYNDTHITVMIFVLHISLSFTVPCAAVLPPPHWENG